jgi:dienelactone hydrolase
MRVWTIAFMLALASCAGPQLAPDPAPSAPVAARPLDLFDDARQRPVPVMLYGASGSGQGKPLAIISHGYGGHNTAYTFIADALVRRGYVVASIEHLERPGDPPMANSGELAVLRRPVWRIGADSIGFVMGELRRRGLADRAPVVLIGHSNGGDMTMLFSAEHPGDVRAAFSLDNRRMPLPRTARPRICSARSSDYAADPGVLPTPAEREALAMVIADVPVNHNDMYDGASPQQQDAILNVLAACLSEELARRPS